jgi:hypothetical protein
MTIRTIENLEMEAVGLGIGLVGLFRIYSLGPCYPGPELSEKILHLLIYLLGIDFANSIRILE